MSPSTGRLRRAVALAVLLSPATTGAQESLSRAKDYYASASYDDALRVLGQLRGQSSEGSTEVAAYEMFCLFALGRDQQARAAVEQIVRRDPLYRPPAAETSPRVRAFFDEVRRPLLPPLIRALYAEARAHLDRRESQPASLGFDRVVTLIDEFGPHDDPGLADLRLLAVGFRDLARVTAPPAPAGDAPAAVAAPGSSTSTPTAPDAGRTAAAGAAARVYGPEDAGVVAPTAVSRTLPAWNPVNPIDRIRSYRGQLELLIDEAGKVSAITVVRAVHADYDRPLVRAAAGWRFRPATREGAPVRYRLLMDIMLAAKQ